MTTLEAPAAAPTPVATRQTSRRSRRRRPVGRHRRPASSWAPTVLWWTLAVAGLAGWFLCYAFVFSGLQENSSQTRLYATLREQLAKGTAPLGGLIKPGTPDFLLSSPAAGLRDVVVVEGTTSGQLVSGPGHRADSPLPGQAGTSVVFGRSVTYGGPFRSIASLHAGDKVTVTTGQGVFTYRVEGRRRPGDPLPPVLEPTGSRLTLVTAASDRWQQAGSVVYVDAVLAKGQVAAAPAGRPSGVVSSAAEMRGDQSGLVVVVLWLQLLIAVGIGVTWARARWGFWQAWLTGIPLALAALWGTTSAAFLVLPNLV